MTLPEFKRALEAALKLHFPNARLILTEKCSFAWVTDKTGPPVKTGAPSRNLPGGFTRICTDFSRLICENPG